MPAANNKPEMAFKVGAVRVAIWENRRLSGEGKAFSSYKVIIERTYKDEREGFKSTASLGVDDIPKAILALSQAYSFLMGQRAHKEGDETESLSLGLGSEWSP
jgi:hypothetical protein